MPSNKSGVGPAGSLWGAQITSASRAVIRDVLAPTYAGLGFESRAAVKRAAREGWDLPNGAVIQVGDEPLPGLSEGAVPYKVNPDGSLVPFAGVIANGVDADGD